MTTRHISVLTRANSRSPAGNSRAQTYTGWKMINLKEEFDKYEDEYLEFDLVENKLSPRPDICAFLLLDKLSPNEGMDMVVNARHDEIWLNVDCEKLAEAATEEDIKTLSRCGVCYASGHNSLYMNT